MRSLEALAAMAREIEEVRGRLNLVIDSQITQIAQLAPGSELLRRMLRNEYNCLFDHLWKDKQAFGPNHPDRCAICKREGT